MVERLGIRFEGKLEGSPEEAFVDIGLEASIDIALEASVDIDLEASIDIDLEASVDTGLEASTDTDLEASIDTTLGSLGNQEQRCLARKCLVGKRSGPYLL